MKGNEARMVLFLHPVDHLKEGQVSKVKPLKNSFGVSVLLLLGLLLGLGVLFYLLLPFGVQPSQQGLDSEAGFNKKTTIPTTTTTTQPEYKESGSGHGDYGEYDDDEEFDEYETSTVTSTPDWKPAPVTETRGNDSTEESKAKKKTSLPGTV